MAIEIVASSAIFACPTWNLDLTTISFILCTKYIMDLVYASWCRANFGVTIRSVPSPDDEADAANIAFVKISDEAMLREYDLDPLPTLVYFREKFPMIYPGDLSREEAVLDWVMKLKESPKDHIEVVDHRTLRMLLDELDHVAVLFR